MCTGLDAQPRDDRRGLARVCLPRKGGYTMQMLRFDKLGCEAVGHVAGRPRMLILASREASFHFVDNLVLVWLAYVVRGQRRRCAAE